MKILGKVRVTGLLFFGAVALVCVLTWIAKKEVSVSEAGLGENTIKRINAHKDGKVFYSSLSNVLSAAKNSKATKKYYWIGASQLYAINDFRLGDRTAPYIVFDNLYKNDIELFTLSYPNAYPSEFLIVAQHILANTKADGLILGAVYDDMREKGIRTQISKAVQNENTRLELSKSPFGKELLSQSDAVLNSYQSEKVGKKATASLMDKTELAITGFIEEHFNAESIRREGRGQVTLYIIKIRQFIEGLRARYTRDISNYNYPIPEERYAQNWTAWTEILKIAQIKKVPVLIYIAPRPTDFFPYNKSKYKKFKKSLRKIADFYEASFINLEDLVSSSIFGMVDTNFGFLVRDPFHFQGQGHALLAKEVTKAVKRFNNSKFSLK
jgi:hypothetical protein